MREDTISERVQTSKRGEGGDALFTVERNSRYEFEELHNLEKNAFRRVSLVVRAHGSLVTR